MNRKIEKLLQGKGGNYILPFFWQHGESEEVLRDYMRVIDESNIKAVCVESRPHPDFCGEKWWQDMNIILDEAKKRNMKIWILDDSHFPTGYANGAMKDQPVEKHRHSICCRAQEVKAHTSFYMTEEQLKHPEPFKKSLAEQYVMKDVQKFDDDRLLDVYAVKMYKSENKKNNIIVSLKPYIQNGELNWQVPEGDWRVYTLHISANFGYHRDYINMIDKESCKVLLDHVYESHYKHYPEEFGTTIAGFFSDEPELGNGHIYETDDALGTAVDYPWSKELEEALEKRFGESWKELIYLLWENDADKSLLAKVRYGYMDIVTTLVKNDFSEQIGQWCDAHGVKYIGHLIEDNNHHSRMGSSLGHYFRGLSGQHMAGIDDIGGQVFPQGEDISYNLNTIQRREGEFYHYLLGKLGSSAAFIEEKKNGDSMCEIFGNYGWQEGVQLEKYLADHFMVRGINHFVPHAFSPKEFPDPDCPPHFYAHGHNPQYRHFGYLMSYMNRICELINGGRPIAPTALLYHGEGDWTGEYLTDDKIGHVLYDHQMDYHIIPQDVFAERDTYHTVVESGKLGIGQLEYQVVLIPYMQFITKELAQAVSELKWKGVPVCYVGGTPEGICNTVIGAKEDADLLKQAEADVIALTDVTEWVKEHAAWDIQIMPENNRIRCLQYQHKDGSRVFYFVNEGITCYKGKITLKQAVIKSAKSVYLYDAWENQLKPAKFSDNDTIELHLEPRKSVIIMADVTDDFYLKQMKEETLEKEEIQWLDKWKRSICESIDYPNFKEEKDVQLPDSLEKEKPRFSGFVCYQNTFEADAGDRIYLEIMDAGEGVEVFVNNQSLGIQIVPIYRFDLSKAVKRGVNKVRIEVATTLERAMYVDKDQFGRTMEEPKAYSGINGTVQLLRVIK